MSTDMPVRLGLVFLLVLLAGLAVGAGTATTQRHYELKTGLTVEVPEGCRFEDGHDGCEDTLADPDFGTVLGIPTAIWGTAPALVIFLTMLGFAFALDRDNRPLLGTILVIQATMASVLLLGTAGFLFIGIRLLNAFCKLCVVMHTLNSVLALVVLGAAFTVWQHELRAGFRAIADLSGWIRVGGGICGMCLIAFGLSLHGSKLYAALRADQDEWEIFNDAWRESVGCNRCYDKELLHNVTVKVDGALALPGPDESIVLIPGEEIVLVEKLDIKCPHCREHHHKLRVLYDDLFRSGRVGLRLVLRAGQKECLPAGSVTESDRWNSCLSNAAAVCVASHAGAGAAHVYLDWEFEAPTRGARRTDDIKRKVRELAGDPGSACLARESVSKNGALAKHYEAALRLQKLSSTTGPCRARAVAKANDQEVPAGGWFCFDETPSFVVFRRGATGPGRSLQDTADVNPNVLTRWRLLNACLR